MTIDEKMKIVRKALEKGANVSLNFFDCESKEDAENVIKPFGSDFDSCYSQESNEGSQWFEISHETEKGIEIEIAAFYEEEDKSINIVDEQGTLIASILHDHVILERGYDVVVKEESEPFIKDENGKIKVVNIGK